MADGIAKNYAVCVAEIKAYRDVIRQDLQRAGREQSIARKLHVISGLLPDAHRTMPRTLSYLAGLSIPVIALAWWLL